MTAAGGTSKRRGDAQRQGMRDLEDSAIAARTIRTEGHNNLAHTESKAGVAVELAAATSFFPSLGHYVGNVVIAQLNRRGHPGLLRVSHRRPLTFAEHVAEEVANTLSCLCLRAATFTHTHTHTHTHETRLVLPLVMLRPSSAETSAPLTPVGSLQTKARKQELGQHMRGGGKRPAPLAALLAHSTKSHAPLFVVA